MGLDGRVADEELLRDLRVGEAGDDEPEDLLLAVGEIGDLPGASGFVLKDDPPEQLIAAIHTVAAGSALLSPAVTKRVIRQFTRIPQLEVLVVAARPSVRRCPASRAAPRAQPSPPDGGHLVATYASGRAYLWDIRPRSLVAHAAASRAGA